MSATVTECIKTKDYSKDGKTTPIYKVTLSDGTTGESFGTLIPTGTADADLDIQDGQYGKKIKLKSKGFGGFAAKAKGNESFALSYAKDLVVADKVKIDQIIPTAEKLFNWLESKRK